MVLHFYSPQVFQHDNCCSGSCVMYGGRMCPFAEGDMSTVCTATCSIKDDSVVFYYLSLWLQPYYDGLINITNIELG